MVKSLIFWTLLMLFSYGASANLASDAKASNMAHNGLGQKKWIHGSNDCRNNQDPAIDVHQLDTSTWILRQNKCLTYEAPFMYLLVGEKTALVIDTGAIKKAKDAAVYQTMKGLIDSAPSAHKREILVVHSHGHSDHKKGDKQFAKQMAKVLSTKKKALIKHFALQSWPEGNAVIQLGNRDVVLLPTPGHHDDAVSFYDRSSQYLITGDTFYPGQIYIKSWPDFVASIQRLYAFSQTNKIKGILGGHIEMSNTPSQLYPIGSTYQPDEAPLILFTEHLKQLQTKLQATPQAQELVFDRFVVTPMSGLQKSISGVATWLMGG